MKKTTVLLALTLTCLFSGTVAVRADPPSLDAIARNQAAQRKRIQHGVCTGRLTPAEARLLVLEQREIREVKKQFLTDGALSLKERRRLNALQHRAHDRIRRLTHNQHARPPIGTQRSASKQKGRHLPAGQGRVRSL